MIGKLIEIHPNDAFFENSELLGTFLDVSKLRIWTSENSNNPGVVGYYYGVATMIGEDGLPTTNAIFHAVKYEVIENPGE